MNSNEQSMKERQAFDELLGSDHFDDSVCEQHQNDLRSKLLQAFDPSDRESIVSRRAGHSAESRRRMSWRQGLGYAMMLSVCLAGLMAVWISGGSDSTTPPVVEHEHGPNMIEDSQLLASLTAVNAFRDEVSSAALFDAIALCQQDHEGRIAFDSVQP